MAAIAASASGLHSIGLGYRLVRDGDADVMLAGGSETPVYPLIVAGVARIHALSTKYSTKFILSYTYQYRVFMYSIPNEKHVCIIVFHVLITLLMAAQR